MDKNLKARVKKISLLLGISLLLSFFWATGPVIADRTSEIWINNGSSMSPNPQAVVGIGTNSPTSNGLSVVGIDPSSQSDIIKIASSTGTLYHTISAGGTTTMVQYRGFGIPTVSTSTGSGIAIGTSTLSSGSTDLAGLITVVTGSEPATKATVLSLAFGSSTSAFCVFSPANASAQSTSTSLFISLTSSGFSLVSSTTPLVATTTYQFSYLCN